MPEEVNPEIHHERSDVNVRALLWFAAIFVVFGAVTNGIVYVMFNYFANTERRAATVPLTQVPRPPGANMPETPRLQPFETKGPLELPNTSTPVVDMEQMRVSEEQALNNPGWVDKQKGIVRLPIRVAKELTVQRLNAQSGAHP